MSRYRFVKRTRPRPLTIREALPMRFVGGATTTMISIRRQVSELETMSERTSAALEAYRYAVECDAQYAAPAKDGHTKTHKSNLSQIIEALGPNPTRDDFEQNRAMLRAELRDYNEHVRAHFEELEHNLTRLQQSVSDLLGASGEQMGEQETRLETEIGRLNGVLKVDDIVIMRNELAAAVGSLEQAKEEMKLQNRALVTQYRAEIRALQDWNAAATSEAKRDRLTGFSTRSEFERQLGVRVAGRKGFALVYVLLQNAKTLVRQCGQPGEEVIAASAKRAGQVVDPSRGGRWSDDEFLLFCDDLEEALAVSHKLSSKLSGEYTCRENPVSLVRLHLRVRTGVVQCADVPDAASVLRKIELMVKAFAGG